MAGFDSINKMDNLELIDFFEYCMVNNYEELRKYGCVNYHPTYRYGSVYVGYEKSNKHYLHIGMPEILLEMMWDRMINGNFLEQCWWLAKNPFKTSISMPMINEDTSIIESNFKVQKIETINYKNETFDRIGSGTKRRVFLSPCKTFVIKIAKEPFTLGLEENKIEAETYKNEPNSIYAKCELIENGWLKMEYVKPMYFTKDDEYPEWTLQIAEHQVGYNLENKLVAYDYGSAI